MSPSLTPRSAAPFVGREVELELLKEALASSRAGGPNARRVVLVTGGAGVGKSVLLGEFCRFLRGRHEHFLEGRCYPGVEQAYQPFGEIVTQALTQLEHLGVDAAAAERYVARLEPLLPARRAAGPSASSVRERAASSATTGGKWQLYDALLEFLHALGRIAPHTIFIHDLHYADPATLDLLHFLAENLATPEALESHETGTYPGLLVVTSRPVEGDGGRLLTDLTRLPYSTEIRLGGLGKADVAKLLQSTPVIERLLERSGGNPHHIEELLFAVPSDVEDLFLERTLRMPDAHKSVLAALAVLGRPAGSSLLAAVSELSTAVVEQTLRELSEARVVVRALVGGRVRYTFAKEIQQEHYYGSLSAASRRELHRRAAEALESRGEEAELLAFHYLRAQDPRGPKMAALAASALRRAHAYGEASELLEKALPLMEGEARRDALSELADLRKMRGEYGRALHALGRLMMLLPREARGSTLRRAGQLLTLKGSYAAALRLLRKSFTLSSLANDASERAEVRAALAEVHYLRGEHAEAETLCREGLADLADDTTFQTRGDDAREAARVALTNIIGKVRLHQERYDEALEAFEANLRFCRDASRGMEEAAAHNNLGIVFLRRGEYERAESAYQAALDRFEALHDPAGRAFGYQNLGVLHHERADYARALEAYHRGLAGFKRVGNKTQLTNTAINLGNLYLSVGDLSRAERLISFALDIASELSMPLLSAYGYNLLGETLCAAGRWDAARVYLDRAQNLFDEVGNRRLMAEVRLNMARLWLATGKPEKADAALRRVEANVFDERVPKIAGQACLLRAELSFGTGELDKAGEGYEWAREFFVSDSDEEGTWRAHFGLARVAAAQGRTLEAENHYLKARSLIESLCARVPEDLRDTFLREPSRAAVQAELAKLSRDTTLPKRTSARAESSVRRADTLFRAAASDLTQVRSEFSGRRAGGAYEGIIGQSRKLMNVLRVVEKVAPSSSTVLIRGESGTGKERVAEALHRASTRSQKPFVTLNCSALVETLLLSELFGHEKGAFTGAVARKRGRFEVADGGTLFLDEIGDISPKTQVALLRVLQERQFERVGGTTPIKVDVRILCATHRNLEAMVRAGQFREDLYFRLKGVVIEIPPLRDRREDVPLLATHFIERACADDGRAPMLFDEEAMELLMAYDWPGNVRELENLVRTAVLFAEGRVITRADLGSLREFRPTDGDASTAAKGGGTEDVSGPSAEEAVIERVLREEVGLAEMKKHIELECIRRALTRTGGNITQAAKLLRMKRPRLSQIVKEYSDVLKIDTAD